ncbi:MAG: cytochrome c biogenesis protein CcsA [Kiritimatiellae bacterium]|nr:cytochrome c biogenesis protein CcsA [Kiritimatiellia bacterium]
MSRSISPATFPWRKMAHSGFALLIFAYILRLCFAYEGQLAVAEGETRIISTRKTQTVIELETFDESTYTSQVCCNGTSTEIRPNKPFYAGFWQIWQSSWMEMPNGKKVSVFGISHDISVVFALFGGILTLLGAWGGVFGTSRAPSDAGNGRDNVQNRRFSRTSLLMLLCGVGVLCAAAWRGWHTGRLPLGNVYEFIMASAAMLPIVALRSGKVTKRDLFMEILLIIPLFAMDGTPKPLPPALQSPFFVPHVGAYVLGYMLVLRCAILQKTDGLHLGFAFITTGMLLGAAWAQVCWGRWWGFDPKETWSLATFLACAAVFHAPEGSKLQKSLLSLTGILVLLTLFWVNFSRLFPGLHSYSR